MSAAQNDHAGAKPTRIGPARIGIVSLGCPKALVDSERILTRLRAEGYAISPDYEGADAVIVNTCGFLDSARAESLEAIGEAIDRNGRVIVTGCLGAEEDVVRAAHPRALAVTGPHQYEAVMSAVHDAAPPPHAPYEELIPPGGVRLTPRHYAYLKISEGCNNACRFCIIPSMRGPLKSRRIDAVLKEAERLYAAGVKELLVISQDTSAYGVDLKYEPFDWRGRATPTRFADFAGALGDLAAEHGAWARLHYVYPYPHVDAAPPLMSDGGPGLLPYLDIPFQHASPRVLAAMRRPASTEKTLERLQRWRAARPALAVRSTFIVGYPGETDADFEALLEFLTEARILRVGCFKFEPVTGAAASDAPDQTPDAVKQERYDALMAHQQAISADILRGFIGRELDVLVDAVDADGAVGRTYADAPEIDGVVQIDGLVGGAGVSAGVSAGAFARVRITDADAYDLYATPI